MRKKTLVELLMNVIENNDYEEDTVFTKINDSYEGVSREEIISKAFRAADIVNPALFIFLLYGTDYGRNYVRYMDRR